VNVRIHPVLREEEEGVDLEEDEEEEVAEVQAERVLK